MGGNAKQEMDDDNRGERKNQNETAKACGERGIHNAFTDIWLCTRTADEIITLLREERVTPEQLFDVVSRRIGDVNGQLHAVISTCFDRARDRLGDVKEQMRTLRARGQSFPPGYLYGMPVLIKDDSYVKGVRFTMGFYTEDEDGDNVKRRQFTDSDPLVLQVHTDACTLAQYTHVSRKDSLLMLHVH